MKLPSLHLPPALQTFGLIGLVCALMYTSVDQCTQKVRARREVAKLTAANRLLTDERNVAHRYADSIRTRYNQQRDAIQRTVEGLPARQLGTDNRRLLGELGLLPADTARR